MAVLGAGVVYGGFVGPEQAQQRRYTAEIARYRERQELLYLGDTPPGMQVSRAVVGPGQFHVDYGPAQPDEIGYVGLTVRSPLSPKARCALFVQKSVTCTADKRGEMRIVSDLPGGRSDIRLIRRHHGAEIEVSSQVLDEPGLRHLLDTLHPLSDDELEKMMREKTITEGF
jgi:hypothetical protein